MATVKIKWRPSRVEGRAGTVYYQITHRRQVRQLKTKHHIHADGYDDFPQSVQESITRDIEQLNTIIRRFDARGEPYVADDIVSIFCRQSVEPTFFRFMQSIIIQLRTLNKHCTAANYTATLNSFRQFRQQRDLFLSDVTADVIMQYEAYLAERGILRNTTSFYMRILRAVYNRAVEQKLAEQRHPFKHVYTGVDKTTKRALSFAAVKSIKTLDVSCQPALAWAKDLFLFSFYTRGMSFIDMAYLRKSDLKNGILTYSRRKTGQRLSIRWEKCMQDIIDKYAIDISSPYLLPILEQSAEHQRERYRNQQTRLNKLLKVIARKASLHGSLTMYAARHSWASIAHAKHIPLSVISEGMGHDSEKTTQIYLASLDASVVDRANRLILEDL